MPPPDPIQTLLTQETGVNLLVTACAGGFIGLVKQWREGENSVAGMRTFSLWAILGFVAAGFETAGIRFMLPLSFALMGVGVGFFSFAKKSPESHFGPTTLVAALLVFLFGVMMGFGQREAALVLAILVAGIIGLHDVTRRWSKLLTATDVYAGLQFAALTGIILPIVPDKIVWGFFNPADTWRMVLLISGVNLLGYAAMRLLGSRAGLPITGIVGGIASSTAVTLAFSRKSKDEPGNALACAQAVLLASQSMFVRVWFVILALNPAFAQRLLPAFILVTLTGLIVPAVLVKKTSLQKASSVPEVKNPLSLGTALKFGALYAALIFLIEQTRQATDAAAFYGISFISGLLTMDAITVSLANKVSGGDAALELACAGVLAAMAANTILKTGIAWFIGSEPFRRNVTIGSLVTLASIAGGWAMLVYL